VIIFCSTRRIGVSGGTEYGGIANITVIPGGGEARERHRVRYRAGQHGDRCAGCTRDGRLPALTIEGRMARRGKVHERLLGVTPSDSLLRDQTAENHWP
jgi:hypothetical protein